MLFRRGPIWWNHPYKGLLAVFFHVFRVLGFLVGPLPYFVGISSNKVYPWHRHNESKKKSEPLSCCMELWEDGNSHMGQWIENTYLSQNFKPRMLVQGHYLPIRPPLPDFRDTYITKRCLSVCLERENKGLSIHPCPGNISSKLDLALLSRVG